METNNLQTPRFNLVQLLGIIWLTPALVIGSILIEEQSTNDTWFFVLFAVIFLIVSGNLLFKKKWVRYLIFIGLIIVTIGIVVTFLETVNDPYYNYRETALSLSGLIFIIGLFTLTFNINTTIEFKRKRKASINYAKALQNAQLNQRYFLKNTFDLTTCIGLILIAPSFVLLTALYYQVSQGYFDLDSTDDVFFSILTFGSLVCGIGSFLKFKIIRYITLILFTLIPVFMLSEIRGSISYKQLMLVIGLLTTGIIFSSAIGAILFHPITTHSFENTIESMDDFNDILDFEQTTKK